ncbi:MAG: ABC transporter permease [Cytophagales bacterium]|nr:ABC transporter permease [Cytophagales bacterium]MDW8384507.1 ABC transporter permease [Flammeovirgaceae bacterium]
MFSTTHNKSGYPTSNVIFIITTALFIIGLFALFALHAQLLIRKLRENIEIQVFLHKNTDASTQRSIRQALESYPFILKENQIPKIRFISKEEAATELRHLTGEDFMNFLGDNPLRDAFVINISEEYYTKAQMENIKKQIEELPGVFEVTYPENHIQEINANVHKVGAVLLSFVLMLLGIVVILINNSVKLAMYSQRFLIRSMQLVGATPWFIKKPFLQRAIYQGIVGACIAIVLLSLVLWFFYTFLEELRVLNVKWGIFVIYISLLFLGGLICGASAYFSVSRYLKMKLDQLYQN